MVQEFSKHYITVDEYEQMAGIFPPERRLELLEGEIIEISPIGSAHAACVDLLFTILTELRNGRFNVRGQNPIRLTDISEPQPDIAVLRWRDDFYRGVHPIPTDVLLIIEVSDSTLEADRRYKVPLYAQAGIPEVWVANLLDEQVEVHAEPVAGEYRLVQIFRRGENAQARTVEGLTVPVNDIFG